VSLLEVHNLTTSFATARGEITAVEDVSFSLEPGEVLGIVGESGSGKSVTALTIMGLLPQPPARVASGEVRFEGAVLTTMSESRLRRIRGPGMAMVFQEPMTSLNPIFSIGDQITETLAAHERGSPRSRRDRAVELLDRVGIPSAAARLGDYPHQLSGGQRQRVMIAMAIANEPDILIADEPTTALDVTVQAQVIELLARLKEEINLSLLFISHNLDLVAEVCDVVSVMYAGAIVEANRVEAIFGMPRHPYTRELLRCVPRLTDGSGPLPAIPGEPPRMETLPPGCAFTPRCSQAHHRCRLPPPTVADADGRVCCWLAT